VARVQLDEAIGGDHRIIVFSVFIESIDLHQLAFCRPHRIGMLAFHGVKGLCRDGVVLVDESIHRLIVKIVDRLFDISRVLRIAAGSNDDHQYCGDQPRRQQ
jgi:hypothetical protein